MKSSKLPLFGLVLANLFVAVTAAHAGAGGETGGGGDICENRFKIVRDDIAAWIEKGGPAGLTLSRDLDVSKYDSLMHDAIASAKISCTDEKITVDHTEKTCKNFVENNTRYIVCNSKKLLDTDESSQYVLIHHEYAGLSGIEINRGADSDYSVSNQISGFLVNVVVKRLAVRPSAPAASDGFTSCGDKYEAAIAALQPLVEKQQDIESKRKDVEFAGFAGGVALGVSTAPAIVPAAAGTAAESASLGQWGIMVSAAGSGYTTAQNLEQMTTLKDVEGHPVATLADRKIVLETLREAYLGGGEKIYALIKEAFASDFPDKGKLSPALVSQTIVKLDEQQAFCKDTLDTAKELSKRVLSELR